MSDSPVDQGLAKSNKSRKSRKFRVLILPAMGWGYLLLLIVTWVLIRHEGERWWFATMVMFGPRWVFMLPLIVLVPVCWRWRRGLLWIVTFSAAFAMFAILNFQVPWRRVTMAESTRPCFRLMTCNTHRENLKALALQQIVNGLKPDVVVLQEWTGDQAGMLFPNADWQVRIDGEMLIASRHAIEKTVDVMPPSSGLEGAVISYDVSLKQDHIRLINVHLASPHLVFSDALHRTHEAPDDIADNCLARRIESKFLADYVNTNGKPTLIAGDFNTPIDSETFRDFWGSFTDAFTFAGFGTGVTYRASWTRTRIDHIVYGKAWICRRCWLGADVGSPHLPVIAELELKS